MASTSPASVGSSVTISTGVGPVLLEPGQDLEAAPAAGPPLRVRAVGDPLQLVQDEMRDQQAVVQEAGVDDVGDPAVDDGAGVHDDLASRCRATTGPGRRSAG